MKVKKVYACFNVDMDLKLKSSSGGIFFSLAEYVFERKGIVYGVAMTEDCYSAEFISVVDKSSLVKLCGSKYLQAKIGNTFKKVKQDLQTGRTVMFTGTACQINGLKNFLGKEYDNLICVDVICHGVPSAALWEKYVKNQEKKYNGKLIDINFRCKDKNWENYGLKETFENYKENNLKTIYVSRNEDSYMQLFLKDYCLRPSCYNCIVKNHKISDLTIGDFWGINDVASEMNDGMGTSLVIIRTNKGENVFDSISHKIKMKEVTYEQSVKYNTAEFNSVNCPIYRKKFYTDLKLMDFNKFEKKYLKNTLISKIIRKLTNLVN